MRTEVERRSAVLLVWLSSRPRLLLPLASAALLAGALFAPPVLAAPCWLVLLAVVGWLSYLSWPAVPPRGRVVRVATLGALVLLAVLTLTG